jgi:hypothetical protein
LPRDGGGSSGTYSVGGPASAGGSVSSGGAVTITPRALPQESGTRSFGGPGSSGASTTVAPPAEASGSANAPVE